MVRPRNYIRSQMRQNIAAAAIVIPSFASTHRQFTNIAIGAAKRFGINLADENFFDTRQMSQGLMLGIPALKAKSLPVDDPLRIGDPSPCLDGLKGVPIPQAIHLSTLFLR